MSSEKKCIVPGCCDKQSCPDKRWFKLPDQTSLTSCSVQNGKIVYYSKRRIWLEKLGLSDGPLERNAVVCSLHFKDEDFDQTEEGGKTLKYDAVPSRNLGPGSNSNVGDVFSKHNESQEPKRNENIVETVEKSDDDDDDDVEIIEPHRETITLDDDDVEVNTPEKDTQPILAVKSIGDLIKNPMEKDNTAKAQILKCMSPEAITHSLKYAINKTVVKAKPTDWQKTQIENGNMQYHCMTPDGKKYLIQMTKAGSSKTPPTALTAPLQTSQKLVKLGKDHPFLKDKQGARLTDADMSDAMKTQLAEWIQQKPLLKPSPKSETSSKVLPSPKKTFRVVDVFHPNKDKTTESRPLKVQKLDAGKSVLKVGKELVTQAAPEVAEGVKSKIPPRKKLPVPILPNGFVGKVVPQKQIPPLFYVPLEETVDKVPIPETTKKTPKAKKSDGFKYVDIDEIMKNKNVKDEPSEPLDKDDIFLVQPSMEKGEQTDMPLGFSEIYDFIKKNMIDFTFEIFGNKYVLKECGLHFQPAGFRSCDSKKVAFVSATSMSSTDKMLLSGMNFSIGSGQKPEYKDIVKKVTHKQEIIMKDVPSKVQMVDGLMKQSYIEKKVQTSERQKVVIHPHYIMSKKNRDVNIPPETAPFKKQNDNITVVEKDKKIVITPKCMRYKGRQKVENETDEDQPKVVKLLPVDTQTLKMPENEMEREKQIIRKKRTPIKRSRRTLRLPISQMQPAFRGRFSVDRSRFRKNKRTVQESEKERRLLQDLYTLHPIGEENKDSPPKKKNLKKGQVELSSPKEDLQSPVRTRCGTRGKKKDYRNLSLHGTTEETKRTKTKRKNLSNGGSPAKKLKYSDKVGDIESFLEVVLEPDNKESSQSTDEMDTSMNDKTDKSKSF